MTQAIVAKLPVYHPFLSKSQKNLADKKVAGVSLTVFERIRHNCLMHTKSYRIFYEDKESRVFLVNGVTVYDSTRDRIVSVDKEHLGQIFLNGFSVYEWVNKDADLMVFSRKSGDDFVLVRDGLKEGHVLIHQSKLAAEEKKWSVNTRLRVNKYIPPVETQVGWALMQTEPPINICSYIARIHSGNDVHSVIERRIHTFEDPSVRLLDYTKKRLASIVYDPIKQTEYIALDGKRVNYPDEFCLSPATSYTPFCRFAPSFTDRVAIYDVPPYNFIQIQRCISEPGEAPSVVIHYVDLDSEISYRAPFPIANFSSEKPYYMYSDAIGVVFVESIDMLYLDREPYYQVQTAPPLSKEIPLLPPAPNLMNSNRHRERPQDNQNMSHKRKRCLRVYTT